jgi:cytochrome c oxidase assembly protein Cox11
MQAVVVVAVVMTVAAVVAVAVVSSNAAVFEAAYAVSTSYRCVCTRNTMTHTPNTKQQNSSSSSSNTKKNAALLFCSQTAAQLKHTNNDARNLVVYCNLTPASGNA